MGCFLALEVFMVPSGTMKADLQGGDTQVNSSSGFLGPESAVPGFFLVALKKNISMHA